MFLCSSLFPRAKVITTGRGSDRRSHISGDTFNALGELDRVFWSPFESGEPEENRF